MRQGLGLSEEARPAAAGDPQRSARHAIRSQAAAREYAERQLVRAEQIIQDLNTKFHTIRREKAIAIEAARAAHDAQAQAERARRTAEAALINAKSASESAQREARESRAMTQELRNKLALAHQTVETLQRQLEQERQARIVAAEVPSITPETPASADESENGPTQPLVKRRRGRPPGKRNISTPRASSNAKVRANQEPVRWWSDGWTPSA